MGNEDECSATDEYKLERDAIQLPREAEEVYQKYKTITMACTVDRLDFRKAIKEASEMKNKQ